MFVSMSAALIVAGCVAVTVQMGEKNVVEREIDVNKKTEREKEREP